MSTTVDQRVVEMRFDNKQFEQNCSQTMSTLEKLKQRLNLTGASKGLQEVDRAAKKVNMSGLGTSVEAVSAKFSAMQVVGVTALANITNQAVNTGKRMISALTIDPIKTGFQEYETQINAVQTILANTSSKGTNIDQVNEALEELNKYADKTIYNFTEMTRNIGTFTAAGVDLDTSVSAIQGIANLAAVSGSTSQQASTAMYQLSQALAAGTVKLQDWNSVVNAGMGGEVFQNALKRTAKVMGTDVDALIEKYGSFRESLSKGEWLTTDVLTETLNQFTMAAEEGSKEWEEFKKTLKEKGYTEEQATEILKMANTATDAATKVKTFTQLWDVMKESAQSGWSQTWKLIIGDFEEAKGLLTPLADFFTNAINKMSDARNKLLEGALGKSFRGLVDKVRNVVDPIKKSADSIKDVVKSVEEYAAVVDDIIGGNWGTGQERWDKLAAAGYDWAHAQNLVNEKLGSSVRHTTNYKEATEGAADATEKAADATGKLTDEEKTRIGLHARMATKVSDEYMKTLGYTQDQIDALRELATTADKLGMPVKELLDNIDEIDGRWLLMNSFKNIGMSIVNVFKAIAKAYREIFPPMQSDTLFDIIAGFYKFTRSLEVNSDTADKITRTFKGLFAIIDVITTLVGGGLKIAFKLITSILGYFDLDILDVTAHIGDALVKFRDWVDSLFDVSGALDIIVPLLANGAKAVKDWFDSFSSSPRVQKYLKGVVEAFQNLVNMDFKSIGVNVVEGFQIGIKEGISRAIDGIVEIGKAIIKAFCSLLGIHSPSTVFMALGGFIIAGLVLGIKEGIVAVPETLKTIVDKCVAIFQAVDWGTIFAIGVTAASLLFIKKVTDALEALASPLEGLGDIFEATAKTIKNFGKIGSAAANNINAKALRNLVISLGIMAAIVVGLIYFFDKADVSVGAIVGASVMIVALAGVLVGMAWAIGKISDASVDIDAKSKKLSVKGLRNSLIPLAASILIVAAAVKLISTMNIEEGIGAFTGLALVVGAMLLFLTVLVKLNNGIKDTDIDKIGSLMTRLSIAMLLMVAVCKLAGNLSADEMKKGAAFAAGFAVFVLAMVGIHRLVGKKELSKLGGMMLKLAIAMMLMVGVCKLVNVLNIGDALKGAAFAAAFVLFVKGLTKALTVGQDKQIAKLGGLLLSISISMLLMVGVCKLVGKLSVEDMLKGAAFMGAFVLFVKALVWATKIGNDQQLAKVGLMVFSLAAAVGILALVSVAMSLMSISGLAKGITAVGLLSIFMANMIKATKGAQNIKSSLLIMAIAIGVMALAVAGLSFIPIEKLASATAAMGILMGMFAVMIKSAKTIEKSVGTAIVLASVLVVMAGVLWLLSTLDVKASLTNAAALSLLMLAVAGTMRIIGGMKMSIKDSLKTVIGLTAMAVPMAVFAYALSKMNDVENAIEKIATISAMMLAMTGLLALINMMNMGPANFGKALLGIVALTAMVAPMATFIAMLSWMQNIEDAATNATAIIKLMSTMTGLLIVLTIIGAIVIGTGGVAAGAIGIGLLALTAMVAPMAAFIGMLAWMQNIQNAETNAKLIISLMTVMTGLLTQLAIIGPFALIGVSALAALTGVMVAIGGLVVAIGAIDEMTDGGLKKLIDTGLPLLIKLAEGIGLMIGKFAGGMIEGVADSIVTLMESLEEASVHASGIKAGSFDGVKDFLCVLGDLGKTMVGLSFADIFTLGGTSMEKFETDGKAFFKALKSISSEMVGFTLPEGFSSESVTSLLDILKTISSYSVGSSWKELFVLGSADTMKIFETDAIAFFDTLKAISDKMVSFSLPEGFSSESVTSLMDVLKTISNYSIGSTWKEWFSLGSADTMKIFEEDVKAFFGAIKAISTEMVGFSFPAEFSVEGLTTLLDALKSVASTTVGVSFGDIFSLGGTSMEKFQADGIAFFQAAKAISAEMVGFSFPAEFSVEGLTTLLDALKSVGNYSMGDSWKTAFSWFPTQDAVTNFKEDGVNFFKAIREMATEASGITTSSFDNASTAIDKLKQLIGSVKGIDYSGVKEFTGIGSGGLGADGPIHDIAVALKDFSTQLLGVNLESLNTATTAAARIRSVIANLAGLDTSGVSSYKQAIEDLGEISLDGFINTFNVAIPNLNNVGVNMINALIAGIQTGSSRLQSVVGNVLNQLVNGIRSKQSLLSSTGSSMMDGMIRGIRSKQGTILSTMNSLLNSLTTMIRSRIGLFNSIGIQLMTQFVMGMMRTAPRASAAMTTAVSSALSSASGYYNSFYSLGSSLVDGFVAGISANSYKASAQAAAMASAAYEAAKEELDVNSPSKIFRALGFSVPEGFAMGIDKLSGLASKSAESMADGTIGTVSDTVSRIADSINRDIDSQPTIRPILDLSNVRDGASSISNMFGFGTSVGLMTNVGAISSGMNGRNQNGTNNDVVSAIDKLRKDIGSSGGNTYVIDGITYDDGSNISSAVGDLIRAAKIGGRM